MSVEIWKALSGVLCVYKHSGMSSSALKKLISTKIVEGVTDMEASSNIYLPSISLPIVEPIGESQVVAVVGKNEVADYRYHPLVCGKSIRIEDIQFVDAVPLETNSSGICLIGLNDGCDQIAEIMSKSWTNVYRLDGILGKSINKSNEDETDISKISRHRFEKVLARIESEFKSLTFQYANVDLESDEAFQIARKGLPRAQLPHAQIIYSLQLNWFKNPRFSLTIHSSGEDDEMLRRLIDNIAANLSTKALLIRLQRQYFGPFNSDDALLEKQINLQNIIRNISINRKIIATTNIDEKVVIRQNNQENQAEQRSREIFDGLGLKNATDQEFDAMRPAWPRNY